MLLNHVWLGLCWLIYCFMHSLLASLSIKSFFKRKMGASFRHYRLAYTLFAFFALVAIILFQLTIKSSSLFHTGTLLNILGGIIGYSGLALMLICIKKYFMSLSGLKSLYTDHVTPSLLISGIHRYIRHPLYLGTFAFIWGLFLIWPLLSLLICNVVITLYTLYAIRLEERKLIAEFGDSYRRYKEEVPMLLPGLRPKRTRRA
ncbi:MAG TPA: isoprenylcysteine carboxylmethyltransferase family protein [Flavisolibacter sp.]|jgi:protein-S-isoprenylcysteine O-methyltransferase Ste14|nr:isoprenylcysteine carboxylmethyltransferase family protein [Flavisolibacter sp.]